jgi:hypothetical protein
MAHGNMKFYPNRKICLILSILSFLASCVMTFLIFSFIGLKSAVASLIFFGIFIFFVFPVLKNQVVDVHDNHIVLYSFGKGYELSPDNLIEVAVRDSGIVSFRFEKGTSRFQISPCSYYCSETLERKLNGIFSFDGRNCRTSAFTADRAIQRQLTSAVGRRTYR